MDIVDDPGDTFDGDEPHFDEAANPGDDSKPMIVISPDLMQVNDAAIAALASECDVFQRGNLLVRATVQEHDDDETAAVRRTAGTATISRLEAPTLQERFARCATWLQPSKGPKGKVKFQQVHPPCWSVKAVLARGDWPGLRPLNAVATHPVLLVDGTILDRPGYHQASGILVSMPSSLRIDIPDKPSRTDVARAVAILDDVIADFPFEKPEHRAAWYAGLLTPMVRHAFRGPAPMFLADANTRGCGKGMLLDVIGITLTGRRLPVMSYTNEDAELRKRITSIALAGDSIALFDNVTGEMGNGALDAVLTSDTWHDRILSTNQMYNGPLCVTWFATGNNVELAADTSRRVCHIRMVTPEEHPERRAEAEFRHPRLREYVEQHRAQLLSALLTIVKAWVAAGRPRHGLAPWGSFEGWSDIAREICAFAGLPDPGETREALQASADRAAICMASILRGMRELDPDSRGLTCSQLIKHADDTGYSTEAIASMREAVRELCPGRLTSHALSGRFRHFARRNFDGMMLDIARKTRTDSSMWVVIEASRAQSRSDPAGDAGIAGDSNTGEKTTITDPDVSALWH